MQSGWGLERSSGATGPLGLVALVHTHITVLFRAVFRYLNFLTLNADANREFGDIGLPGTGKFERTQNVSAQTS